MVDSLTLLADTSTNGSRTRVLKSDTTGIQVRANPASGDDHVLFIDLWLGGDVEHLGIAVDGAWMLPASVSEHERTVALQDIISQLQALDYAVTADEPRSLKADNVTGSRRTSVLKDDEDLWELRAKLLVTEDEEAFVDLRVWYAPRGYMHLVVRGDGTFVASTTGGNDKETWERMRGELGRRDIDVS